MAIQKNIGKNTIGDNNKMSVNLHTYNMSTHDLSTIWRNTQSAGTLVPNLCFLAQKGDSIDIDIESHVLTHPTIGPLFGSFKHENHIFSVPIRLYNSWLHNNRTKIGLNMSDIKLPQLQVKINKDGDFPTAQKTWSQINPSCLLAYLGIRGFGTNATTDKSDVTVEKLAIPLIGYYDIFKNCYANTQEENFYTIGATEAIKQIVVTQKTGGEFTSETPDNIQIGIAEGDSVKIYPINTYEANELTVTWIDASVNRPKTGQINDFGNWNKATGIWTINISPTTVGVLMSISPTNRVKLQSHALDDIDEIRDQILQQKGNTTFIISKESTVPDIYKGFTQRLPNDNLNTTSSQYGLALKTYNSDLLQNWKYRDWETDRKSTRLNSSHITRYRMPSSA